MSKVQPHGAPLENFVPRTSVGLRFKHIFKTAKGELLALRQGTAWIRRIGNWSDKVKKTPVIICPGATGCALFYKEWALNLAKAYDGPVLLFDRFNMGLSDRLDSAIFKNGLELYSDQLSQIMENLEIRIAHFVGFSYGAVVVAHFAALFPQKVERIAMVCNSPFFWFSITLTYTHCKIW
jgi:pimeloyl-ACP methyl ester carboxylesterase